MAIAQPHFSQNQFNTREVLIHGKKTKAKDIQSVAPWRPFVGLAPGERDMDRYLEDFFGRRARAETVVRHSGGPVLIIRSV
jgi:hypothetical protein